MPLFHGLIFVIQRLPMRLQRLLVLLLIVGLPGCQQGQPDSVQPTPLPQDAFIQVYTNHNPAAHYIEPYRQQTRPGDDLEQVIVETIAAAQLSVDVAVQELRLPKVTQALLERKRAGVKVRVILENTYARPFSSYTSAEIEKLPERDRDRYAELRRLIDHNNDGQLSPEEIQQGDALVMLDSGNIPRIDDTADGSAGSHLMHHKFVIVDNRWMIVTSANFTTSDIHGDFRTPDSRGNANNLLKLDSSELATLFTQEFNFMWGDGPGGKPDSKFGIKKPFRPARQIMVGSTVVEVQFSPTTRSMPWNNSGNGLIGKTLSEAKRSTQLALFVFSDQLLVNLLEAVHKREVEVQALIDPGFAFRPYSEALDMLGIELSEACNPQPGNRLWSEPITTVGVPRLPPGDLLHHKFGIVDQQVVITGSHNWTEAANYENDETILVIHSPIVAAHFHQEFGRLYNNAILGIPPAIQRKVGDQQLECKTTQLSPTPTPPTQSLNQLSQSTQSGRTRETAISLKSGSPEKRRDSKKQRNSDQRVNLNTATQSELETLPGVGAKLAQQIIAARQKTPFTSLKDLDQLPGVGAKLIDKLQDQVTW